MVAPGAAVNTHNSTASNCWCSVFRIIIIQSLRLDTGQKILMWMETGSYWLASDFRSENLYTFYHDSVHRSYRSRTRSGGHVRTMKGREWPKKEVIPHSQKEHPGGSAWCKQQFYFKFLNTKRLLTWYVAATWTQEPWGTRSLCDIWCAYDKFFLISSRALYLSTNLTCKWHHISRPTPVAAKNVFGSHRSTIFYSCQWFIYVKKSSPSEIF